MSVLEVIVREPKLSGEDLAVKITVILAGLAIRAGVIILVAPPAFNVFGIEVAPNFGEALCMVLFMMYVLPLRRFPALSATDKNRYLKENN